MVEWYVQQIPEQQRCEKYPVGKAAPYDATVAVYVDKNVSTITSSYRHLMQPQLYETKPEGIDGQWAHLLIRQSSIIDN